jgi:hypothetical protein
VTSLETLNGPRGKESKNLSFLVFFFKTFKRNTFQDEGCYCYLGNGCWTKFPCKKVGGVLKRFALKVNKKLQKVLKDPYHEGGQKTFKKNLEAF